VNTTYRGIEGLRAWLAWTVVASHIFQGLALWRFVGAGPVIAAGNQSVFAFIVISGFVITHLILSRAEPYPAYIGRRFLRLYPVYLVCLAVGIVTTSLYTAAIMAQPWGALSPPISEFSRQFTSEVSHPVAHLLAHLTMLQGLIPDQMLDNANVALLGPAWSLSLEWQFYLVAPFIVAAATRPRGALVLTLLFLPAYALYWVGRLGTFGAPWGHPSMLLGAAPLFAIGIATRIVMPGLPPIRRYPVVPVLWVLGCIVLVYRDALFLGIWLALVPYMLLQAPVDRVSRMVDRVLHALLDSRIAIWLGQRSYATYLIHFPLVQAIVWACARAGLGYWHSVAALAAGTITLTLIASAVIHRWVERPGIALGKALWSQSRRVRLSPTGPAVP
jgi:peptidoglycan/LPS O-acetylase OafA/YrhL